MGPSTMLRSTNSEPRGSDTTNEHQGGTYYLQMNSECNWHVIVKG